MIKTNNGDVIGVYNIEFSPYVIHIHTFKNAQSGDFITSKNKRLQRTYSIRFQYSIVDVDRAQVMNRFEFGKQ